MQKKSQLIVALAAAAMFVGTCAASSSAAPRAACSVLSVAEVRAIIGSPVVVFEPSSEAPTVHGDHTDSNCVYMLPGDIREWKGAGSGFFHLTWGPSATLMAGYESYTKRHFVARIKGDVLASAMVSNGKTLDPAASTRLLEAVLKKL